MIYLKSTSYDPRLIAKFGLDYLSHEFNIDRPKLRWSHGRIHGIYRPQDDLIIMGPNDLMGVDSSLVHCFTHVLLHKTRMVQEPHGLEFCEVLWQVSLAYFKGDPTCYSWFADRANVFEFYANRVRSWKADKEFGEGSYA